MKSQLSAGSPWARKTMNRRLSLFFWASSEPTQSCELIYVIVCLNIYCLLLKKRSSLKICTSFAFSPLKSVLFNLIKILLSFVLSSVSEFGFYQIRYMYKIPSPKYCAIGGSSKAGLHESVPFVIFRLRRRERSQLSLPVRFLSRRWFTLFATIKA